MIMTEIGKKRRSLSMLPLVAVLVLGAFAGGYALKHFTGGGDSGGEPAVAAPAVKWTCSMHPEIVMDKFGLCPKCAMDLIPMNEGPSGGNDRQLVLSESAIKLMEIQTVAAERKTAEAEIRMVGKIAYDETRIRHITSWVAGRIDELYVDYTGIAVAKGDHMVYIYSPQLLSVQAELLQAVKSAANISVDSSDLVRRSIEGTLKAARQKMGLLGISEDQVAEIEKSGEPVDHMTIFAPIGGVVIEKNANEGMYVQTGTKVYTIADLSQLWVKLDAYESDMAWIRYGQAVEFTTEAYPGEVFEGTINFIDPVLDARTRTVKLRVNVDNSEGRLKPEMFVRAVVRSRIAAAGRVMDPDMAGKWICPMHLDVVKDSEGKCDLCGMDLVKAESLNMAVASEPNEPPLVIPATAPLITGKRAVVYVRIAGTEKPTFEGREVVLGPRAGDYYIIKEGLAAGEMVVTNGNFKLDSELQLRAKPSMMSSEMWGPREVVTSQTICPVMGGKIDMKVFTEYEGQKVYFCCPACIDEFNAAPEKYLDKLPQFKEAEQTLCPVMGNAIDKNIFVDYKGKRVYFCCKPCIEDFEKEPEKYLAKLPQFKDTVGR